MNEKVDCAVPINQLGSIPGSMFLTVRQFFRCCSIVWRCCRGGSDPYCHTHSVPRADHNTVSNPNSDSSSYVHTHPYTYPYTYTDPHTHTHTDPHTCPYAGADALSEISFRRGYNGTDGKPRLNGLDCWQWQWQEISQLCWLQ